MRTVIFVNRNTIAGNKKHGTRNPPIHARDYRGSRRGHVAIIRDEQGREVARVGNWPETPLKCGATVWIETEYVVELLAEPTPHGGSRP